MKLIMENWKKFLNEERPPVDPRLLPALAQDAMEVVAANPGVDVGSITLATMAQAGSELPLIDMESVATITLGALFDEAGLQDIMQGALEFAGDEASPEGSSPWASPDISDEEDTLQEVDTAGIKWSKHNPAPMGMRGDVYNVEDEQLIQQALGPDYYVVEYQYDAGGEAGMEAQDRSRQYFDKYVSRPSRGPNGEIVVMPQKTLERGGGRANYFKIAHVDDLDEDGNMYAQMVS
jgi:hypothetical protein